MNNLNYPLRVTKFPFFEKINMMEHKIKEENIENNLAFSVSNTEKHLQSNQYKHVFIKICHIRTK